MRLVSPDENSEIFNDLWALVSRGVRSRSLTALLLCSMRTELKWWLPTGATMLLSLLSYVDRNTLALLAPTILGETHLSAQQYGWIISAFSAAYLVGSPVWGRTLDRFGVRWGLAVSVALWSTASALHAFASTVFAFAAARAALGFGEGATFPAGLATATQTLRPDQRARGLALAYSGGSLGAIATPLLVTPIAARWGWRGAFLFTGLLGMAWLALWVRVAQDPRLARSAPPPSRSPALMNQRSVWGFMAAYAFGGLPLGFVLYAAPLHLSRALGCSQTTLGRVLWIPPLGWEIGYFFWGNIVDRAARRGRGRQTSDRLFAYLAALATPLALTPFLHDRAAVLATLF